MAESGVAPGQVLDNRYVIERRLGQGGVGQVFLAHHQRTGRPCAVKLLSSEGGLDQSSLRRFEREARTLGHLGHPGIVGIHDFSETPEGVPFLVMDYLDGEDLAARLRRDGAMGWATARPLFREMAHALHTAHASGVLHRDLKPGNVFLARMPGAPERVVLLDFGMAKAETNDQEALSLTRTGSIFGTPLYMSPEQARGDRLDQRSDLYSLATVLFEMLAGRPPYLGANLTQLVSRLLLDPVPVLSDVAGQELPAHLDGVLGIALAKSPEDRFPSVAAFAEAVLEEPVAEAWARPVPLPTETLLATIASEPPRTPAPGDPPSPGAARVPDARSAPAEPGTRSGSEPRYDGSLANLVTLESGEPLRGLGALAGPRGPEAPALAEAAPRDGLPASARGSASAGAPLTQRHGASSWMLHAGIFLFGMAAAAAVFWLVFGRGPTRESSSRTPSQAALAPGAPRRVGPTGAHGERGATSGEAGERGATSGEPRVPSVGRHAAAPPREAEPRSPDGPGARAVPSETYSPGGLSPRRRPGLSSLPGTRLAPAGAASRAQAPRAAPRVAPARVPGPAPGAAPGTAPGAAAGAAPAMAPPSSFSSTGSKMYEAGLLRGKAVTAERLGKGRECLTLLDQADRIHAESASTYAFLRGWCLMRVGRCAAGKRMLGKYYQQIGVGPATSKATVQWAENAKCPATSGTPDQQLTRVHLQLTTACAMNEVGPCGSYARLLLGLIPKLPRPLTPAQTSLVNQGLLRAGICMAAAGHCRDAWQHFSRATAMIYGSSPMAQTQAEQYMRVYAKGCPAPASGP